MGAPLQESSIIGGICRQNGIVHALQACNSNAVHDVRASGEMARFDEPPVSWLFDHIFLHGNQAGKR
jgi:hypothetical protein